MTRGHRSRYCSAILATLLLGAGCSSGPPAPDWKLNASQSLERATSAWLRGEDRVEELEFARARAQLARTARPQAVAQAELIRCATRVAALAYDGCPAFDALAADASPEQLAYARYLRGEAGAADIAHLPAPQRRLAGAGASPAALRSADDPLSALVAAGVSFRRGNADAAAAQVAIERASNHGWRRPLLAWLLVARRHAESAGHAALVQQLQRRIELLAPAAAGQH